VTRGWLALVVLVLVPVAHAAVAEAGHSSCGGGGGAGGSGGGHGGGGHGGGGGHASCTDDSDVVGYRHCTSFGAWASKLGLPHIAFEAGAIVRRFGSLLDGQTGHVTHGGEAFAYRVATPVGGPRSLDTAVLSTMRATVGLSHGFYSAVELDLGGLAQPGRAQAEMSTGTFGTPDLAPRRGFVADSLGTIGVHSALHGGGVGVELSGGMRAVSYHFRSSYHDCEQMTVVTAVAPIAEARVRGELWLSPWVTAGVTAGTSVLESHAWMGGLYIGLHTRAFGGER
jgi:hypothetical protein